MRRNKQKFSELESLSMCMNPCGPMVYLNHKQKIDAITGTNGLMGYM